MDVGLNVGRPKFLFDAYLFQPFGSSLFCRLFCFLIGYGILRPGFYISTCNSLNKSSKGRFIFRFS